MAKPNTPSLPHSILNPGGRAWNKCMAGDVFDYAGIRRSQGSCEVSRVAGYVTRRSRL